MLVELVPRRGAFVKQLSPAELLQLYEVRLRLEPLGAYEAARHIDKKSRQVLDDLLANYCAAVQAGEAQAVRLADYRFHMAIMNLSGNTVLERILSSFAIVSKSNQRGLMKSAGKSLQEHEALRDAIASGNADLSERLMREHLSDARDNAARIAAAEVKSKGGL